MLNEINANAALPTGAIQLRADGAGRLFIDGPAGFALTVLLQAGDPVEITRLAERLSEKKIAGIGRTLNEDELTPGQSAVVTTRSEVRTLGISSWLTVTRHADDGSQRSRQIGGIGEPTVPSAA